LSMVAATTLESRLEGFRTDDSQDYTQWNSFINRSIDEVGCSDTHDNYMYATVGYLRRRASRDRSGLVCILAENEAAKVLGIERPDLLAVYDECFEVIEVQNGGGHSDMIRKALRYGVAVDRFSIAATGGCIKDIRKNWRVLKRLKLDLDESSEIYEEHLKILGFRQHGRRPAKAGNGLPEKSYRIGKRRLNVDLSMAMIHEKIDIGFYSISKSRVTCVEMERS
jgi:hypothetical protein